MGREQQLSKYEDVLQRIHFYKLRRDIHCVGANYLLSSAIEPYLISVTLGTAEALVAHSCFDGVMIGVGEEKNNLLLDMRIILSITEESDDAVEISPMKNSKNTPSFYNVMTVLAESIFLCHLSMEEVELAGLKVLLTTGCRTALSNETGYKEAMLKGSQLLQAIQVCYRIYLITESKANRTTPKAALRQIVTSAFKRLVAKNKVHHTTSSSSPSKTVVEKEVVICCRIRHWMRVRTVSGGALMSAVTAKTLVRLNIKMHILC